MVSPLAVWVHPRFLVWMRCPCFHIGTSLAQTWNQLRVSAAMSHAAEKIWRWSELPTSTFHLIQCHLVSCWNQIRLNIPAEGGKSRDSGPAAGPSTVVTQNQNGHIRNYISTAAVAIGEALGVRALKVPTQWPKNSAENAPKHFRNFWGRRAVPSPSLSRSWLRHCIYSMLQKVLFR